MSLSNNVEMRLSIANLSSFVSGGKAAAGVVENIGKAAADVNKRIGGGSTFGLLGRGIDGVATAARKAVSVLGLGGLVAGGLGLAGGIRAATNEANSMAVQLAQTQAVLTSTGGVAGITAGHVRSLASTIESYSGIQDIATLGAENLMLGFTGIRNSVGAGNDVFDRAIKDTADLSTRMGRDVPTAALTLGKALQNPLTGMMMLRRSGIVFSTSQQDVIKALAKSGDLLDAQKMILAQVEKQVGGAARAYGQTFPGAIARMRAATRTALGEIVMGAEKALTGPLTRLGVWFAGFTDKTLPKLVTRANSAFSGFVGRASHAFDVRNAIVGGAAGWGEMLDYVVGGQGRLTDTLTRLVQTGMDLWHVFQNALPTLEDIARVVGGALWTGFKLLEDVLGALRGHPAVVSGILWGIFGALVAFQTLSAVAGIITGITAALKPILGLFGIGSSAGAGAAFDAAGAQMLEAGTLMMSAAETMATAAGVELPAAGAGAGLGISAAEAVGGASVAAAVGGAAALAVPLTAGGYLLGKTLNDWTNNDTRSGPQFISDLRMKIAGVQRTNKGNAASAATDILGGTHALPRGHTGATLDTLGDIIIRGDERVVHAGPGAQVTPTAVGDRMPSADAGQPPDIRVQLMVDQKVLAEQVIKGNRFLLARQ